MILFLLPIAFIFCIYVISNLFDSKLKLDNCEKPIFSLGCLVLILNYLYFNFNIDLETIFNLFIFFTFFGLIIYFFKKKIKDFKKILIPAFIIIFFLGSLGLFYGDQFYVFRGNIYDHFVYISSGVAFNFYKHSELIEYKQNFPQILKNEFYLEHVLNLIYFRPSVQLFLGFLLNFKLIDVIQISYTFKIINTVLVSISSMRFFNILTKNLNSSIFLSLSFVFSFYYFYNFEIDAFSLIFSLPFIFLLLSYIIELKDNLDEENYVFFFKIGFVSAISFIIYPNGSIVIFVPIFIYVLYLMKFSKNIKIYLLGLFISGILFCLIIYPTSDSTVIYLIKNEIPVGLNDKNDFWGYYGAFIFGKDNPIHDIYIVNEIKRIWSANSSINSVLPEIIKINFENNLFFLLNLIPSIFGFYHFSLSNNYGLIKYILGIFLIFINLIIIKRLFKNFYSVIISKEPFRIFLKICLIFFSLFFIYLIINNQLWSAIKLYFILAPIIFIFITVDFTKINPKFNKKIFAILLMLLPIYKYSEFNYGIGKLDSFPSILKKDSKLKFNWNVDRKKLGKCNNLDYELDNKFHKIYISLIFKTLELQYVNYNCVIKIFNGKFIINKIK